MNMEGKISKVSKKVDGEFKCGIKLEGEDKWFIGTDATMNYIKKCVVGDSVQIEHDNNILSKVYIKQDGNKPEKTYSGRSESSSRSYAVSYAKDLVIADKVELSKMLDLAESIRVYLDEGKK